VEELGEGEQVGSLSARKTELYQKLLAPEQVSEGTSTTIESEQEAFSYVYRVKYSSPQELVNTLKHAYGQAVLSNNAAERLQQLKIIAAAKGGQAQEFPRFIAVENPQTNALLIVATKTQIAEIANLLKMIDARPLQVFLDMAIAEVSLLDEEFFGIQGSLLSQGQITANGETNSITTLVRLCGLSPG
jgi:type II secretory pathway component GspD/PulD (secretin)